MLSEKSKDEESKLEHVSNPNHNDSPPKEQTVEDEAVENVYYNGEGTEVEQILIYMMSTPGPI